MIGCSCEVCLSDDPFNKRFRSSIFVETEHVKFVVDTTPDFRSQCLRAKINSLDAVIYTHEHSDHLLGLDELRRFCILYDKRLPVYASRRVMGYIERMFPYAVIKPPPYKGLPELDLNEIRGEFKLGDVTITPFEMPHGNTQSLGFRFSDSRGARFAYLTDCKEVSENIRKELRGIPVLILDALRKKPHPTHLSLDEAVDITRDIKPGRALFTHIHHELEHHITNQELSQNIALAYDGQVLEL